MVKPKFSLAYKDPAILALMTQTDHKILAVWAIECTERVIHYFEDAYPDDPRPRKALQTLQTWIETGEFKMKVIRAASLNSHAAAREVGADDPARSAARSAGQAVATAHVRDHALGSANYAVQAIFRATNPEEVEKLMDEERTWQYQRLLELSQN